MDRTKQTAELLSGFASRLYNEQKNPTARNSEKFLSLALALRDALTDEQAFKASKRFTEWVFAYGSADNIREVKEILEQTGNAEIVQDTVKKLAKDSEKKRALTLEDFEKYLDERGIKLSCNVISNSYEIEGADQENLPIDSYSDLVNQYTHVTKDITAAYAARISRKYSFNPVMRYLDGIVWDGKDRISELCDIIRIKPEDHFSRLLVRKWCCQAIRMAQNDFINGIEAQGVLTLISAQGAGKSTLTRRLGFNDPTLTTDTPLIVNDRDSVARITSYWIAELAELGAVFKKNDPDALKQFITSPSDRFRLPYGHEDTIRPRRTSFIATLNPVGDNAKFLKDHSGNRRWWTVECELPTEGKHAFRFDFDAEDELDYKQLWAQALDEVNRNGETAYKLTAEELQALNLRNAAFEEPLPAEEELRDIVDSIMREDSTKWAFEDLTSSEIIGKFKDEFPTIGKFDARKVSAALKKMGFEQKRGRRYSFPCRKYAHNSTLQALANKQKEG